MKAVHLTANILFHLSRPLAILYSLVTVYAIIVVLSSYATHAIWVPINIEQGRFVIFFPFTHTPFILGDYAGYYLIPTLLVVIFYSIFLWLLSGVFDAFRQKKMFVTKGVNQLSRFFKSNLAIPAVLILISALYNYAVGDMIRIAFLHGVLGVFAFFMTAIFKEGVLLQEEQDLTL
jgi:hypothetical protein